MIYAHTHRINTGAARRAERARLSYGMLVLMATLCLSGDGLYAEEPSVESAAKETIETEVQAADRAAAQDAPEGADGKAQRGGLSKFGPLKRTPLQKSSLKKRAVKVSAKKKKKRRRRYPSNRPKRALKPAPELGKIPFPLGERLAYKVNLLNAHSGTVTLKVGQRGTYQGKKVLELSGFIQSSPFLENFYPIRDSLSVLVDEVSFLPLKSEFFLNEKGREITFISKYDPKTKLIDWRQKKVVKGKPVTRGAKHMPPVHIYESLSSLYALRRLPLAPGLEFEQYVWDGKRERLIGVKVLGEERVLTDLGWFETYKIELTSMITGGIVSRKLLRQPPVKGLAWVAKDAYRTPVKLITPTRLGQAEAVLSQRGVDVSK